MPPPSPQFSNGSPRGEMFSKKTLWIIIGAVAVLVVIIVAFFFGPREQSKDEIKAAILRSLSAPSDAPQISAEEKTLILESLSAPSKASKISAEEKQRILKSLSAPSQ